MEAEVTNALRYYDLTDKIEEARSWYNGYIFGNENVYNPWSILNYLQDLLAEKNWHPRPYWANTSSNSIIRELAEIAGDETKDEIEALIRGGSITKPVHEDIVYGDIKRDMDNFWNFLFFTGYLKKTNESLIGNILYFGMNIPNAEVLYIYQRKIREWFEDKINAADMADIYSAILGSDAPAFEQALSALLAGTISYFDSRESFYHGFLAGILTRMNGYIVKSNRESGNGRGDIFLLPVSVKNTAVVFELKMADSYSDMEKSCAEALSQIHTKKYEQELRQTGYGSILKYGIAFYRKDCMVRI